MCYLLVDLVASSYQSPAATGRVQTRVVTRQCTRPLRLTGYSSGLCMDIGLLT